MNRRVERGLIDRYAIENNPGAVEELARKSKYSTSTWHKARVGRVPVKPSTRRAMAKVLGVTEDELFPLVAANGEDQAS